MIGYAIYGGILLCVCCLTLALLLVLVLQKNLNVATQRLFIALLGLTIICTSMLIIGFVNTDSTKAGLYCFTVLMCYMAGVLAPTVMNVGNELILKTLFKVMKKNELDVFYEKRKQTLFFMKVFFFLNCLSLTASAIAVSCLVGNESLIIAWRILCAELACGLAISMYFLQYIFAAFALEIEVIVKQNQNDSVLKEKMLQVAKQMKYGRWIIVASVISPLLNLFCAILLPMFWYVILTQIIFILLGILAMIVVFFPPQLKRSLYVYFGWEGGISSSSNNNDQEKYGTHFSKSSTKEKGALVIMPASSL